MATMLRCLLPALGLFLIGCAPTRTRIAQTSYTDDIYGLRLAEKEGQRFVVVDVKRNDYLVPVTRKWEPLLEADAWAVTLTPGVFVRRGDRLKYSFGYSILSGPEGRLVGTALVVDPGPEEQRTPPATTITITAFTRVESPAGTPGKRAHNDPVLMLLELGLGTAGYAVGIAFLPLYVVFESIDR